jgi:hypothetical protein
MGVEHAIGNNGLRVGHARSHVFWKPGVAGPGPRPHFVPCCCYLAQSSYLIQGHLASFQHLLDFASLERHETPTRRVSALFTLVATIELLVSLKRATRQSYNTILACVAATFTLARLHHGLRSPERAMERGGGSRRRSP